MPRKINQAGLDLIKHFEGFEPTAYWDPVRIPTIGFGHTRTVTGADVGHRTITEVEGEQLLRQDCAGAEEDVERLIDVPLNGNEFSALVSFTFNLGGGALKRSTLRRKLNAGARDAVPSEMAKWVKAGGKTLRGLVRRRHAEGDLFVTPVGDEPAARDNAHDVTAVEVEDTTANGGQGYLSDSSITLERGSVDDSGDANHSHLSQNVPDGYVTALQRDLTALGFGAGMTIDGAFGLNTRKAVKAFEQAVGIDDDGIVDRSTSQAIAIWLKEGHTRRTPPGGADGEHLAGRSGAQLISPQVPHFSQGDARWGSRTLGRSSSLSRQGCAIAAIAMIQRFYGRNIDPGALDVFLDANSGYAGNSVKWGVAAGYSKGSGPKLAYARKNGSAAELVAILHKRIDDNRPTMVRVDYGSDSNLTYNHFVVAVGTTPDGDIIMNDPGTRHGDGYANPGSENTIQKTGRKQGYKIVQLDWYDPAD